MRRVSIHKGVEASLSLAETRDWRSLVCRENEITVTDLSQLLDDLDRERRQMHYESLVVLGALPRQYPFAFPEIELRPPHAADLVAALRG
jgi:hypothetical protein